MDKTQQEHDQGDRVNQDAEVASSENRDTVVTNSSPSNAALVRAGLKANLSSSEAKAQLRLLCRKFAALIEKVKEETKVREAAEQEVCRLQVLLDKKVSPRVTPCQAETIDDLQKTQDKLKRELRLEKEKNERIVVKALELEREKSSHLALQTQQQAIATARFTPSQQSTCLNCSQHQSAWDKEQMLKIQSTLKLTIEELEDELAKKEEEIQTCRERSQRDRARLKALEDEIQAKDDAERVAQEARHQLETDLRQAQTDITNELENMQRIHDQAQEDRAQRDTLEQQLMTLGDVNAALEQRSRAVVRRLELLSQECQNLKLQLREAEGDNETLGQTIRCLKEEQGSREKKWKLQVESANEAKASMEQQLRELQDDFASLQAQNSLFSEWMLVRNENAMAAQRESSQKQEYLQQLNRTAGFAPPPSITCVRHVNQEYDTNSGGDCSSKDADNEANHDAASRLHHTSSNLRIRPATSPKTVRWEDDDSTHDMSSKPGLSTSSGRMSSHKWQSTTSSSPCGISRYCKAEREVTPLQHHSSPERMHRKVSSTSTSSMCSSTTSTTAAQDDHERLRKLMSRNRELQQRLQQRL